MEVYHPKTLPQFIIDLCHHHGIRRLVALTHYEYRGRWHNFLGRYSDGVITLVLPNLFNHADRFIEYGPTVAPWITLLETTLHEIRHHQQATGLCSDVHDDEGEVGYHDSWPERDARAFARRELLRLADRDEATFMPDRLRGLGYVGARISRAIDRILDDIHAYDGFDNRKWKSLRAFWQFTHNAGLHVPAASPHASYAESRGIVHRTDSGRRYRFLTPAQSVRHYVFSQTSRSF